MPKDIGQGRKRYAPLAQIERFLDLLRACNAIQHHKGGPQRKDLGGGLELDPAQDESLFARAIAVVKAIPLAHRLGKQFRVLHAQLHQILAILCHVGHTGVVVRFTLKGDTDMLVATGWLALLRLCVAHHSTVWSIFALPSLLIFSLIHAPQNPLALAIFSPLSRRLPIWFKQSARASVKWYFYLSD